MRTAVGSTNSAEYHEGPRCSEEERQLGVQRAGDSASSADAEVGPKLSKKAFAQDQRLSW